MERYRPVVQNEYSLLSREIPDICAKICTSDEEADEVFNALMEAEGL